MFRKQISLGVVVVYLLLFAITAAMLWVTLDVIINYYTICRWVDHAVVTGNLTHLYDQLSTGSWWEFGRVWLPDIRLSQLLIALLVLPLGSWFAIGLLISAVTNRDDIIFGYSSIIVSILMITIFAYSYKTSDMIYNNGNGQSNYSIAKVANHQVQKYAVHHIDHANEFQRIDGTTFKVNRTTYHVKDKNNIIMNYRHQPMTSRQITVEWTQYDHVPKYLKTFSSKDLPSLVDDNNSLKVIIDQ